MHAMHVLTVIVQDIINIDYISILRSQEISIFIILLLAS